MSEQTHRFAFSETFVRHITFQELEEMYRELVVKHAMTALALERQIKDNLELDKLCRYQQGEIARWQEHHRQQTNGSSIAPWSTP